MNENRLFPFEARAVAGRIIEGRAAPFNIWSPMSNYLERLAPKVFKRSIDRHGGTINLHFNHQHNALPVGTPVEWRHEKDGLYGVWQIREPMGDEPDVWKLAGDGLLPGLSVGFTPKQNTVDESGDVPRVTRVEAILREVSMVPVPSYEDAKILLVRGEPLRKARPHFDAARRLHDDLFG